VLLALALHQALARSVVEDVADYVVGFYPGPVLGALVVAFGVESSSARLALVPEWLQTSMPRLRHTSTCVSPEDMMNARRWRGTLVGLGTRVGHFDEEDSNALVLVLPKLCVLLLEEVSRELSLPASP